MYYIPPMRKDHVDIITACIQFLGILTLGVLTPFYGVNIDIDSILRGISQTPLFYLSTALAPPIITYCLDYFGYTPFRADRRFLVLFNTAKFFFYFLGIQLLLWKIFFASPIEGSSILLWASQNIIITSVTTTALLFILRAISNRLRHILKPKGRMLVVGAGWAGKEFLETYYEKASGLFEVYGFVDDNHKLHGTTIATDDYAIPVLGSSHKLAQTCEDKNIDVVVLAITNDRSDTLLREIYECRKQGVIVNEMAAIIENVYYKIPVHHIGKSSFTFDGELKIEPAKALFSRIYNSAFAFFGLMIWGAFCFPIIAIFMKLKMPGPLFYSQVRVGLFDKPYTIYKLRTMVVDAEKNGAQWATTNDNRIPPLGKLMRKTRLDEFPQLWNVLKGEMNIVGPRPERPEFVQDLEKEIPYYSRRHLVRPGITGWAQTNYKYGNTIEDSVKKLEYDLFYIKNKSFTLDLYSIIRTFKTLSYFEGL